MARGHGNLGGAPLSTPHPDQAYGGNARPNGSSYAHCGRAHGECPEKVVCNRMIKPREFNPRDRVLVVVSMVELKFLAAWQGPFEVIDNCIPKFDSQGRGMVSIFTI